MKILLVKNNLVSSSESNNFNTSYANFKIITNIHDDTFYITDLEGSYFTVTNIPVEKDSYSIKLNSGKPTDFSKFIIRKENVGGSHTYIQGYSPIDKKFYYMSIWKGKENSPFVLSQGYDELGAVLDKKNFQFDFKEFNYIPLIPLPEIENKSLMLKPKNFDMVLNYNTRLFGTVSENTNCFSNNKLEIIRENLDHYKIKIKNEDKYLRYYSQQLEDISGPKDSYTDHSKFYFGDLNPIDQDITTAENSILEPENVTHIKRIIYNSRFNIKKTGSDFIIYLRDIDGDKEVGILTSGVPEENDTIFIKREDDNTHIKFGKVFPTSWAFIDSSGQSLSSNKKNYLGTNKSNKSNKLFYLILLILLIFIIFFLFFYLATN